MRVSFILIIAFFSFTLFSQTYSESDIKKICEQVEQELKGVEIGNDIRVRGCLAIGRNIIYQFDVPDYWKSPINIKKELISNLKTEGAAKNYFLNNIDVDFHYYKGNSLVKKVSIKSNEFSTNEFELGNYMSIKDHLKSKGVNLKVKVPKGWEVKEGDRPNIVKKFTKNGNTFFIIVKDNMTFFSRSESRELLSNEIFVKEFIQESVSSWKNPEVIEESIETIDTYPSFTFKARGKIEKLGVTIPLIMRCWIVIYEDKIVLFQGMGIDNAEFIVFELLYFSITNSVIFPDQYN